MARCVRRAFLCGRDKFSGKNYEHRRRWVEDRLKKLSGIFALEICAYTVMSNHYHVILHIHREQAESWSMKEVLSRWTQLFSGPMLVQRYLAGITLDEGNLLKVEEFSEEYRRRLKDISWSMRCLNEHLAREANIEDGCKGRFYKNHPWFLPFGPAEAVQIYSG
ncbi:transposase [uncultured Endozoicomonas sp.]|uniref:transposase n=1 Tax=uncultured Endozoicomonas sp. TaxID=432652 RepID=UPI0026251B7F|nr:transposase [uncultured Endozoicomonas sp.]